MKRDESMSYKYSRTYGVLESLYERSLVPYCIVNANGTILDCNEAFTRRIGYSKSNAVGMQVYEHIGPNSLISMHEYIETCQKRGFVENCEVWLRRKDNDVFPALLSATSVFDEYDNVVGCNIAFIDQTDVYKTKKNFEKINGEMRIKEQLKNEFIAIASHELRTPIQPLLGYAILAKKGKISQEAAWEGVLKEARRLQQLANDILDVSRIESGSLTYQMEKVSIYNLLETVIGSAKANLAKDVSLEFVIDEASKELEVELDRSRITQVLSNIIGNATKFTQKGSIKIEILRFMDNNKIEIKVSDTGGGIPEQILPNLFGKFVTKGVGETNGHGGTGLGLFISKAIVTAHKGEIYANNNNDCGATFTIVLPINQSVVIKD